MSSIGPIRPFNCSVLDHFAEQLKKDEDGFKTLIESNSTDQVIAALEIQEKRYSFQGMEELEDRVEAAFDRFAQGFSEIGIDDAAVHKDLEQQAICLGQRWTEVEQRVADFREKIDLSLFSAYDKKAIQEAGVEV